MAMLHEFRPHLHTPKNLLKQIQRCFSLSSDACFCREIDVARVQLEEKVLEERVLAKGRVW